MPPTAAAPDTALPLLRDVSRSFYLSIRLLPAGLRDAIALAYLLARATDTLADTQALPAAQRLDLLAGVAAAFDGSGALPAGLPNFAAAQAHAGERRLLEVLGACVEALERLAPADRADVRQVLSHIVRGQSLDLQRFGDAGRVRALPDAAALHEYTYLVAGCVGEFWTDLCWRHVPGYASLEPRAMRELGRTFGCGLQLVNIVRDAGEDLRAGRCYFPADELEALGLAPADILARPQAFSPVWARWQDAAGSALEAGMAYALAVNPRRIRAAVAIPAVLGRRTLVRVREAGAHALGARVKVPRSEVRALLLRLALGLASRGSVQAQWDNRGR
jgi:farnesyl-diphosphate farnesyltransferase